MRTITVLRAAGHTDPGLQRDVNEDRFHFDVARGLFAVVDGVGGQAAGGKAADVALSMLRTRLERETGPTVERVREAITIANNEIHRVASLRPEWSGMACVLTVAVVEDGRAVIGHVGDTRLYKLCDDRIEKITRDHSPVGEREDASEISELEAMHHPRRNEVYRDVGSELHEPADTDFIDLHEIPFEADAALLVCSDGLTDVVESASINDIVHRFGGQPQQVVHALIDAANDAGGKDNVTVVYVEGERFAPVHRAESRRNDRAERSASGSRERAGASDGSAGGAPATAGKMSEARQALGVGTQRRVKKIVQVALVALLAAVTALALYQWRPSWPLPVPARIAPLVSSATVLVVQPTDSIAAALERAGPGSTVLVEPGEYRERVVLRRGVRVVSRVPRAATIRLPGTASERDPAVVAAGVSGAELVGFRIVGDAATPLGTGLLVKDAELSVVDIEITGAVNVAIHLDDLDNLNGAARVTVMASDIHDNPGAALAIRGGAPRIAHNVFLRNGLSERAPAALNIEHGEHGAQPRFSGNVFHGITSKVFGVLSDEVRAALVRDNWFPDDHDPRASVPTAPRGRQSR
jgi:serine/threonine protein phosphatase PrpC